MKMEDYSLFIKEIFDRFKCKSPFDILKLIPVYDREGIICAYLRPVTKDYRVTLPGCAALLSQWRRENPSISTGTFEVTEERTEKWLDRHVVDRDDRILFLILGLDGTSIGHLGFSSFNYEERCCEVDAVLRGIKDRYPGIMAFAMHSLIYWGLRDLKLEHIKLRVFSDNEGAIAFYYKCGFVFLTQIPLYKVKLPGEEKWEVAADGLYDRIERYYTEMELDMEGWEKVSRPCLKALVSGNG